MLSINIILLFFFIIKVKHKFITYMELTFYLINFLHIILL